MKNKIDERLIMRPAELKPILGLHSSTIGKCVGAATCRQSKSVTGFTFCGDRF